MLLNTNLNNWQMKLWEKQLSIYLAESGKFQIYMINSLVSLHWAEICRLDNRLSQTTPCRHVCSWCTALYMPARYKAWLGSGGRTAPGWSSKHCQGRQNNQHFRNNKWTQTQSHYFCVRIEKLSEKIKFNHH